MVRIKIMYECCLVPVGLANTDLVFYHNGSDLNTGARTRGSTWTSNPKYENTIQIKYNIIDTPKISGRNRDNDTTTLKTREKWVDSCEGSKWMGRPYWVYASE